MTCEDVEVYVNEAILGFAEAMKETCPALLIVIPFNAFVIFAKIVFVADVE